MNFGTVSMRSKRQEPAIEFECFFGSSGPREIEEVYRFAGKGVDETGDPSDCSSGNPFDDCVIHTDEDRQPVAKQ